MKKIFKYFLQGLLYIIPISTTFYLIYIAVKYLYDIISGVLETHSVIIVFAITLGVIFCVMMIGYLGSRVIAAPVNNFFSKLLNKAPLIKTIYTSIKDLTGTFVGQKKGFKHPVLVKIYDNSTIQRIGFITNDDIKNITEEGNVLVYLPHSYAISGQLFLVNKKNITPIDGSSTDIMKLIISGGIT